MITSWHGNDFRVSGPLRGEPTGHRWIPSQRVSNAGFDDVSFDITFGDLRRHDTRYDITVYCIIRYILCVRIFSHHVSTLKTWLSSWWQLCQLLHQHRSANREDKVVITTTLLFSLSDIMPGNASCWVNKLRKDSNQGIIVLIQPKVKHHIKTYNWFKVIL